MDDLTTANNREKVLSTSTDITETPGTPHTSNSSDTNNTTTNSNNYNNAATTTPVAVRWQTWKTLAADALLLSDERHPYRPPPPPPLHAPEATSATTTPATTTTETAAATMASRYYWNSSNVSAATTRLWTTSRLGKGSGSSGIPSVEESTTTSSTIATAAVAAEQQSAGASIQIESAHRVFTTEEEGNAVLSNSNNDENYHPIGVPSEETINVIDSNGSADHNPMHAAESSETIPMQNSAVASDATFKRIDESRPDAINETPETPGASTQTEPDHFLGGGDDQSIPQPGSASSSSSSANSLSSSSSWVDTSSAAAQAFRGRYAAAVTSATNRLAASKLTTTTTSMLRNAATSVLSSTSSGVYESTTTPVSDPSSVTTTTNDDSSTPATTTPTSPPQQQQPLDQATRIRTSVAANHYQELTRHLQSYEYVVLLGRGRFGVTLKPCFCAKAGVYTDALVPGGAAALSGLVSIGDIIVRVGNVDCSSGTIATVPTLIAQASRPVHITLATSGAHFPAPSSGQSINNSSSTLVDVNHVDVAVAALYICSKSLVHSNASHHGVGDVLMDGTRENNPPSTSKETTTVYVDGEASQIVNEAMSLVQSTSFDEADRNYTSRNTKTTEENMDSICPVTCLWSKNSSDLDAFVNPTVPDMNVCHAYQAFVAQRNTNPGVFTHEFCAAAALTHTYLRHAILNALMLCAADGRRLMFWQRHLQRKQQQAQEQIDNKRKQSDLVAPIYNKNNDSALLSFFMGMFHFVDLHGIMSESRRLETAHTIAYKFLLPKAQQRNDTGKNELNPPLHDFHTIVSDVSLRALETALFSKNANREDGNSSVTGEGLSRNVFVAFQSAALEYLSGLPFQSFFVSPDCARMRAYLRHTAPYINVSLPAVLDALTTSKTTTKLQKSKQAQNEKFHSAFDVTATNSKNYIMFCLVYLLCMAENEDFGENDDMMLTLEGGAGPGNRIENAAGGLCASLFIRRRILPLMREARHCAFLKENGDGQDLPSQLEQYAAELEAAFEQFWECFMIFGLSAMIEKSRDLKAERCFHSLRSELEELRSRARSLQPNDRERSMVLLLTESSLTGKLISLSDELLFDFAIHLHPKFRVHKFHEWLCAEIKSNENANCDQGNRAASMRDVPALPDGSIKRFLRKVNFPVGITPHQPSHDNFSAPEVDVRQVETTTHENFSETPNLWSCNADCAIVFGSAIDLSYLESGLTDTDSHLCRYTCQSVALVNDAEDSITQGSVLSPAEVPTTIESYTRVPFPCTKPFETSTNESWCSADGWHVTLVSFTLPCAEMARDKGEDEGSIFGASLLLQRRINANVETESSNIRSNIAHDRHGSEDSPIRCETPYTCDDVKKIALQTSSNLPTFTKYLSEQSWSDRLVEKDSIAETPVAVGLALVSKRNVVLAMRECLSLLLQELCKSSGSSNESSCRDLVDVLGNFVHQDIEPESLKCILEPFMRRSSQQWLERPIGSQKNTFLQLAGDQLIRLLPPIPFALMLIVALLEQKIVLTSSRRSVLLSVSSVLVELLQPLKWCHLIVARVPSSLASDLLQYPAPFILGLASEDDGAIELIRDLPEDVTLVDLDVGRVILASSFACDNEFGRRANARDTVQALRRQVLYLAQSLGGVIGSRLDRTTWCSDNPLIPMSASDGTPFNQFHNLRGVCRNFVEELVAGTSSCCYWVEDCIAQGHASRTSVSTVLFDEDRFFRVKEYRQRHRFFLFLGQLRTASELALSLTEFDLIFDLLLRCQSMNAYIGSIPRHAMAFSL